MLSTARRVIAAVGLALSTLPAAVGATAAAADTAAPRTAAAGSPTPCAVTAKACMDLSSRRAWLTDGAGKVTYGPVAARGGTSSAPTPVGTFHVLSKDKHFYSTQFDAPMPYSVFFYPGDAFHADNTSVASNGCIHLSRSSAQHFYNTLSVGDRVQVVS